MEKEKIPTVYFSETLKYYTSEEAALKKDTGFSRLCEVSCDIDSHITNAGLVKFKLVYNGKKKTFEIPAPILAQIINEATGNFIESTSLDTRCTIIPIDKFVNSTYFIDGIMVNKNVYRVDILKSESLNTEDAVVEDSLYFREEDIDIIYNTLTNLRTQLIDFSSFVFQKTFLSIKNLFKNLQKGSNMLIGLQIIGLGFHVYNAMTGFDHIVPALFVVGMQIFAAICNRKITRVEE